MKMRHKFPREFYIPKNSAKVADKLSDAVAYVYTFTKADGSSRVGAAMFFGEQAKPVWHYTFRKPEDREKKVSESFASRRASLAFKAELKAKRKAEGRGLEVGDILKASWGYDQTNIDYYEVTALIGRTMVEMRPLAQESIETMSMQGKCVPLPGQYTGKAKRHVAKSGGVRLASYMYAFKCEPELIGGVKVYKPSHWTAYA
jgi:hypothetical protein